MKTVFPDYLNEFCCLTGSCRHTCCVGWEIDIDPDSLRRFRSAGGETGKKLARCIEEDEFSAHFVLDEKERCPFLDQNGLCELITEFGEDFICDICADHPRFRNFFSFGEEIGLGLCCEAACRLVLSKKEPMKLIGRGESDACPDEYESELLSAREAALAALCTPEPIGEKLKKAAAFFGAEVPEANGEELYRLLFPLERLDPAWEAELSKLKAPHNEALPAGFEQPFARLAEYFFFRHVSGAAEDGREKARAAFSALAVKIILLIFLGSAEKSFDSLCESVRMFSGEIEYSDENLYLLFDHCEKTEEK